jgi:hypothetical protein
MLRRPRRIFCPFLERLEIKQLPSAGPRASHVAQIATHATSQAHASATTPSSNADASRSSVAVDHRRPPSRPRAFLGFRITNPKVTKVNLIPPFGQVLAQTLPPVPGQVYNVLSVAVKNGTNQTFTADNGFTVRFPNRRDAPEFPILSGTQQWRPNRWIVFYVLTKQYYPLTQLQGGFQFNLGGRSSTLVPGPSAIFLRLKYNPATFQRSLNTIVAFGQGAQLGLGPPTGIATTNINQIVAARTRKIDFGGHF